MSADVAVTRAWTRARRLYKSEGFQRAYVAGAKAKLAGKPADECPYRRRPGGGWSAWRVSWMLGWQSVPAPE